MRTIKNLFFALPTNAMAEAVKITVSSRLRRDERARLTNASYQAILPFVALVPPRLVNVAAQAAEDFGVARASSC